MQYSVTWILNTQSQPEMILGIEMSSIVIVKLLILIIVMWHQNKVWSKSLQKIIPTFLRVNEFYSLLSTRSSGHCSKGWSHSASESQSTKEFLKIKLRSKVFSFSGWGYIYMLAGYSSNGNWKILLLAIISSNNQEAAELTNLLDCL